MFIAIFNFKDDEKLRKLLFTGKWKNSHVKILRLRQNICPSHFDCNWKSKSRKPFSLHSTDLNAIHQSMQYVNGIFRNFPKLMEAQEKAFIGFTYGGAPDELRHEQTNNSPSNRTKI